MIFYVAIKALEYRSHINHFLDKYNQVMAEFSGREIYKQANSMVKAPDGERPRVVFLGSQLTTGWDLDLYFPEIEAINRGVDSQRVAGFPLRFYPDVIRLQPKAVVIEVSSYNFRPEQTVQELKDYVHIMVDIADVNNVKPIIATVIPPRSKLHYGSYSVADSALLFNDWLRAWAMQNNISYIDFAEILRNNEGLLSQEFSVDHITLNDKGYGLISASVDSWMVNEILVKK